MRTAEPDSGERAVCAVGGESDGSADQRLEEPPLPVVRVQQACNLTIYHMHRFNHARTVKEGEEMIRFEGFV